MAGNSLLVLSFLAVVSQAFQNTSPFFAFSNSSVLSGNQSSEWYANSSYSISTRDVSTTYARSDALQRQLSSDWIDCKSTELFLVVSQPGVATSDYATADCSPFLQRSMSTALETSRLSVSGVVGSLNISDLQNEIQTKCGLPAQDFDPLGPLNIHSQTPQALSISFLAPSDDATLRSSQLRKNDEILNAVLQGVNSKTHTVFYATGPPASLQSKTGQHLSQHKHASHRQLGASKASTRAHQELSYDAEEQFHSVFHMEMKRDMDSHAGRAAANGTERDVGLFEAYNFLNHGVFMGGLVVVILLSILYVGLSAIASVEITPFAFSKEMAPTGQKKQT